jgi:hypothetical protein
MYSAAASGEIQLQILSVHGQFEEQTQATHCGNARAPQTPPVFTSRVFDGCFD